jgi:WD40 repeat protein
LAFRPDGTMAAVVDGVGDLWVMQLRDRRVLRTIRTGHNLCGVAWTPDGVRLATGDCGTTTARLWETSTGRQLLVLRAHRAAVRDLAFTAGGG